MIYQAPPGRKDDRADRMTPEAFRAFIAGEQKKWQEVVRVSGAKVDG